MQLFAYQRSVHAEIWIRLLVHRAVVTGKTFAGDFRKPPTLVQLWVIDQDVPTPEDVTELIDIQAVCLEVREDRGLLRRKALGRLDQPTAVAAVASGQLDEQADPGAHPFGLRLAGLGAPRGRPDRGASHVARVLGQAHATMS